MARAYRDTLPRHLRVYTAIASPNGLRLSCQVLSISLCRSRPVAVSGHGWLLVSVFRRDPSGCS